MQPDDRSSSRIRAQRTPPSAEDRVSKRRALRKSASDLYRRAILDAAERVFARSSFASAKIADIAVEAGMAAGTLYNYFDSKEAIFQALCEELGEQLLARFEALHGETQDVTSRLQGMVGACLSHIEDHHSLFLIFHEVHTELGHRKAGSDEIRGRVMRQLERALRDGMAADVVRRDLQAPDLVALLTGAINGYVHAWFLAGGTKGLAARAATITDVFLNGAAARGGKR